MSRSFLDRLTDATADATAAAITKAAADTGLTTQLAEFKQEVRKGLGDLASRVKEARAEVKPLPSDEELRAAAAGGATRGAEAAIAPIVADVKTFKAEVREDMTAMKDNIADLRRIVQANNAGLAVGTTDTTTAPAAEEATSGVPLPPAGEPTAGGPPEEPSTAAPGPGPEPPPEPPVEPPPVEESTDTAPEAAAAVPAPGMEPTGAELADTPAEPAPLEAPPVPEEPGAAATGVEKIEAMPLEQVKAELANRGIDVQPHIDALKARLDAEPPSEPPVEPPPPVEEPTAPQPASEEPLAEEPPDSGRKILELSHGEPPAPPARPAPTLPLASSARRTVSRPAPPPKPLRSDTPPAPAGLTRKTPAEAKARVPFVPYPGIEEPPQTPPPEPPAGMAEPAPAATPNELMRKAAELLNQDATPTPAQPIEKPPVEPAPKKEKGLLDKAKQLGKAAIRGLTGE